MIHLELTHNRSISIKIMTVDKVSSIWKKANPLICTKLFNRRDITHEKNPTYADEKIQPLELSHEVIETFHKRLS